MENQDLTAKKPLKSWISITGYRTLIILKLLMDKGRTIEELAEIIKSDQFISKSVSKDTIRLTINTLKSAGCEISRPNKSNGFKYELLKHPFSLQVSDAEWNIFLKLREKFVENLNWQDILVVNSLYSKLALLTGKSGIVQNTKNMEPLSSINKQILFEFKNPVLYGHKLNITYKSPEYGEETLEIIPKKISFENGKIYLWCVNLKYSKNSILNVERILKINTIGLKDEELPPCFIFDVLYMVDVSIVKDFELKENEEIVEQNENSLKILAHVDNEFLFEQRLLLLGANFKIISPLFFREKLINKIKLIQKRYED